MSKQHLQILASLTALVAVGVLLVADQAPPKCEQRSLDLTPTYETDCGGKKVNGTLTLKTDFSEGDSAVGDALKAQLEKDGLVVDSLHVYDICTEDGQKVETYNYSIKIAGHACGSASLEKSGTQECKLIGGGEGQCTFSLTHK